jgi:type IV pilus assembly protein PilM
MVIDVDTFALQNCYEVNYEPNDSEIVMLLNIGASTMNVNIIQGTRSLFTRDITVGGSQFTESLQRSLGVSSQEAELVKRGIADSQVETDEKAIEPFMNNVMDIVSMEIQKTFDFYRATAEEGGVTVQKILISGGGSKLKGLHDELARRLEIPVEVLNPFRKIKVDSRKFDPDYLNEVTPEMAVAVGLALRGAELK